MSSKPVILIQGATGNTGFACCKSIAKRSHSSYTIRAGVNDLNHPRCKDLKEFGFEVVNLNMASPSSIREACKGTVEKVLIIPPNKPERDELTSKFVSTLKDCNVKHIVMLSVFGAQQEETLFGQQFHWMEKKIESINIPHTFLRSTTFMENFIGMKEAIKRGVIRLPIEDGQWAPVAVDDVGEAMAAALLEPSLSRRSYDITGPAVISGKEIAKVFSEALRKSVTFVDITPEEFKNDVISMGVPAWQVPGYVDLHEWYAQGRGQRCSHDAQKLSGKKPMSFAEWVNVNLDAFL